MRRDPNHLTVVASRGPPCYVFGTIALLVGLATLTSPLWGNPTRDGKESAVLFLVIPLGLVFSAAGAALLLHRTGVTIDLLSQRVTYWRTLVVRYRSSFRQLAEGQAVALSREIRGAERTYTVYPVRLSGPEEPIDIDETREYSKARKRAEEIARFLNVAMEDTSTGEKVIREPGMLDESLRDRLRRTGRKLDMPKAPPGTKSQVTVSGDEAVLDIPATGFGAMEYVFCGFGVATVVGLAIGAATSWDDIAPGGRPGQGVPIAFIAGIAIFGLTFAGAMVLAAVKSATTRQVVTVSPRSLRLERRWRLGSKIREIPAEELEELQLGRAEDKDTPWSGKVIVARSDRATLEIGRGLVRAELEWVKDVIEFIVTA